MRIVIVGGGKLGYHLAQTMLERDYEVELIEKNKLKCAHLADVLDVEVICGDGTEIRVLADAGTHKADCFIAVTGSDQDTQTKEQNLFTLHRTEGVVYAAKLEMASGIYEITEEQLINSFRLIHQDWKTGET